MLNYLEESYHGSLVNMLVNCAYYCYTIRDIETNRFYSGSRGVQGRNEHDLLISYFTSSAVTDFREKLKKFPKLFDYRIEYFRTRFEAFEAETAFHLRYQVDRNPFFINSSIANGSNCGSGSVLCRGDDGKIYRITVQEFATGKHRHISKGMMNIRTDQGVKKIPILDFDPTVHTTEFKNHVLALDTKTGRTCRIQKKLFETDDRYVGITKGMVVAYDTVTNCRVTIPIKQFRESAGRYVGNTRGIVPVIDQITGEKKLVPKEEYDKTVYRHHNTGKITVYSISKKQVVKISKDEYEKNNEDYANLTTKIFYKVDGRFFKSKILLDEYYRETRGKTVLKTNQFDISYKFSDIKTITREEHDKH